MSNMITKKQSCTHKKIKYIGTQTYIDATTGELKEFNVTNVEERDFNFTKVWVKELLHDLDELGNKKLKTATYILEHTDKNNRFIGTFSQMEKALGFSRKTICATVKILMEANLLKRITSGCYLINAEHIFKGEHKKRMNILKQYNDPSLPKKKLTDKEKIANLEKTICELNNKITKLKEQGNS